MEKKEDKKLSFGRFLSAVRFEKGLDLSDISKKIKVHHSVLQLIENEDHEKLPDDIFIKGFVRTYAETLGVNGDDVVALYLESNAHYQHTLQAEADLVGYTSKYWNRILTATMILFAMICFSILLMPVENENFVDTAEVAKVNEGAELKEEQLQKIKVDEKAPVSEIEEKKGDISIQKEAPPKEIPENLYLKIQAVEETWIKIVVDMQKPREFTLKPGDLKELKGDKSFNLLIGNATGVRLYLNYEPVEIIGKKGQIATVMLP